MQKDSQTKRISCKWAETLWMQKEIQGKKSDTGSKVIVKLLGIYKQIKKEEVQMRKTATKVCGYGETNTQFVGMFTVKYKFHDAEE